MPWPPISGRYENYLPGSTTSVCRRRKAHRIEEKRRRNDLKGMLWLSPSSDHTRQYNCRVVEFYPKSDCTPFWADVQKEGQPRLSPKTRKTGAGWRLNKPVLHTDICYASLITEGSRPSSRPSEIGPVQKTMSATKSNFNRPKKNNKNNKIALLTT